MTPPIHNLMMDYPLTLTHYFERSRKLWGAKTLATRVPGQPLFRGIPTRSFSSASSAWREPCGPWA
jgi:hypothetical protein